MCAVGVDTEQAIGDVLTLLVTWSSNGVLSLNAYVFIFKLTNQKTLSVLLQLLHISHDVVGVSCCISAGSPDLSHAACAIP